MYMLLGAVILAYHDIGYGAVAWGFWAGVIWSCGDHIMHRDPPHHERRRR